MSDRVRSRAPSGSVLVLLNALGFAILIPHRCSPPPSDCMSSINGKRTSARRWLPDIGRNSVVPNCLQLSTITCCASSGDPKAGAIPEWVGFRLLLSCHARLMSDRDQRSETWRLFCTSPSPNNPSLSGGVCMGNRPMSDHRRVASHEHNAMAEHTR